MKRKPILLALLTSIITALAFINAANAEIETSLTVRDANGNNIEGQQVPVNTVATVTAYYEDSHPGNNKPSAVLTVWFKTQENGIYSQEEVLFDDEINNDETITRTYEFKKVGYFQFTWAVLNKWDSATVSVRVGPVLSEPAAIAALGLSLAAIGAVLYRKKPTKT